MNSMTPAHRIKALRPRQDNPTDNLSAMHPANVATLTVRGRKR
jgi:hypothetical protein